MQKLGIVKTFKPRMPKGYLKRPMPPDSLLDLRNSFAPSIELEEWAKEVFIMNDASPLWNPSHKHLRHARIGYLWTTVPNQSRMNRIVGQAELGSPPSSLGRWAKAKFEQQSAEWFGIPGKPYVEPDFVITLDAEYWIDCEDIDACSLFEHEHFHCGQKRHPRFGTLQFDRKTGLPKLGLRGHDVEEFVEITERYGPGHSAGRTADLVRAAQKAPTIGPSQVSWACGNCVRLAA